jgi:hypothetical protein
LITGNGLNFKITYKPIPHAGWAVRKNINDYIRYLFFRKQLMNNNKEKL